MTHNQTRLVGFIACAFLVFYTFIGTDFDAGFTIANTINSFIAAGWAILAATFALGEINN